MKKKIVILNLLIVIVALIMMFGLGILVTRSNHYEMARQKITELTEIYANNYSPDEKFTEKIDSDIRVTVIDSDGRVIADSEQIDLSGMENHLGREEIIAAAEGKTTVVTRKSDSVDQNMMYCAKRIEYEGSHLFVRVAVPIESVNSYIVKSVVPMIFIMIFALSCSLFASIFFVGGLMKPLQKVRGCLAGLSNGEDYSPVPPMTDDDDVNKLLAEINEIGTKLHDSIDETKHEKEKLGYILDNISDGIVVADNSLDVVITNRVAKGIFGVNDSVGRHIDILTSNGDYLSAMSECAKGKNESIFQMQSDNRWYLCTVRHTDSDFVISVLSDITASKTSENLRLEFFANASHELKTPLTTIKGFNDMISLKADSEIRDYSERIDKEVTRMTNLIDDMLGLSRLENSSEKQLVPTELSLNRIACDVADGLSVLAGQKKVSVSVEGDATVFAEREHMYELIRNLTENAIRYNNDGGKVDIMLADKKEGAELTVSDNGIGIDSEHQSRIFERFYRVDKSRSRSTGGTGLGLAIVKHICELYHARITLKSKLGVGTTVTILFPDREKAVK